MKRVEIGAESFGDGVAELNAVELEVSVKPRSDGAAELNAVELGANTN